MPRPPPTATIAEIAATAVETRAAGNSSRMMPNDSGKTAPPMPCTTRAMMRTPMFGAMAASRQPRASAASATTSIRSLPTMSPTRPRIGVKIDAESR